MQFMTRTFLLLCFAAILSGCTDNDTGSDRAETFQKSGGKSLHFEIGGQTFVGSVSFATDSNGRITVSPIPIGQGEVYFETLDGRSFGLVGQSEPPRYKAAMAAVVFFDSPDGPPTELGRIEDTGLVTDRSRTDEFSSYVKKLVSGHLARAARQPGRAPD